MDTNILPRDQNHVTAAGFESSTTPGLVLAGTIDEVTMRIRVTGGGGPGGGQVNAVVGTADRITVNSADPANPIVNLSTSYVGQSSITTLGTITTGIWTGTDIALADGGTGASLSDPGADSIMFWDDSANQVTWLTVGSGLTITGTTLTATGGSSGTVTSVSVTTANGVSGSVATATTTPAITITLGVITPTSVNGLTITTTTGTLTVAAAKVFTVNNTITLAGTDATVMTFPTTSATVARIDAAQTFTGIQTFATPIAAASVAVMTATVGGRVPTPPNNTTTFLRGDGTFAAPPTGGTVDVLSNVATARIIGRTTAGSGDSEELTAAQTRTLLNVADGATANSTNATLLARANHTGTQLAATISDFAATVRATVLTGLSTASSAAVVAADTILVAIGKLQAQVNLKAGIRGAVNAQTGTTYTLVIGDEYLNGVSMSNAAANTITIPTNASVAFPVGTKVFITQGGAGSTTIAAGAGVTINAPDDVTLAIGKQYSSRVCQKTGTDSWLLI